jgi:uncharacterized protein (TIGR02996 family)
VTERESFVASMRDTPADDTPRLAFADWLDERGEHDRAELIRVQVARARLNPRPVLRIVSGFERRYRPATVEYRPESRKGGIARAVLGFEGEFEFPVGALISPGVCFDAIEPRAEWNPDAPERIRAIGCVVERLNPALRGDGSIALAGHVTGIPCPVRPEADALDARAAALMLNIPFGDFCPATFAWFVDAEQFERFARSTAGGAPDPTVEHVGLDESFAPAPLAGAVLVRRGFAEHVRCSWEDWLRWADWFRANHPCERVTLTTHPGAMDLFKMNRGESPGNVIARHQEILATRWRGTSFALLGQHFPMEISPASNAISDYTAQLYADIMQGLGIPPNIANEEN